MRLTELINNSSFSFNCKYRVVLYNPTEEDEDKVEILYECDGTPINLPAELQYDQLFISAVNQDSETGVLDIECYF